MNTSLFPTLNSSTAVKALMGTPPRVYPWGRAPQDPVLPYGVYGIYNGNPENYLDQVPDIDNAGTQVNIYAKTSASCEACFIAIRDALEPIAYMTSYATPDRDAQTDLYSARMDFDFWELR